MVNAQILLNHSYAWLKNKSVRTNGCCMRPIVIRWKVPTNVVKSGVVLEFLVVISWYTHKYTVCHSCILCCIFPIMWYEMCVCVQTKGDASGQSVPEVKRVQLSSTITHNAWFKPVYRCIFLYDFLQGRMLWICRCITISKHSTESRALKFLCNLLFCKALPLFLSLNKTRLLQGGSRSLLEVA